MDAQLTRDGHVIVDRKSGASVKNTPDLTILFATFHHVVKVRQNAL